MSDQLDGTAILVYLRELAEELPDGIEAEIVVVGGAMLALRDLRSSTRDVDSARTLPQAVQGAAARVAQRHDLIPTWLNSRAAPFAGALGDDIAEPDPVLAHPRLKVFLATADSVFLMKLYASRPEDEPDLIKLWPLCNFTSAHEAAEQCNERYDFLGPHDEHLASRVEQIVIAAEAPR